MDHRVEYFVKRAKSCLSNFMTFAGFVSDSEFFADQNRDLFSEEEHIEYDRMWLELEITNALMLANCDTLSVRECMGLKIWEKNFKKDAKEGIADIITLVKNLENAGIVQRGKCIDAGGSEYEFKIVQRRMLHEVGDYDDSSETQGGQTPDCYDVFYENTEKKGEFGVSGGTFNSLEDALVSVGTNPCFSEWI